jgi:3-oxoacyl-[acyl-carrier-protein] synthase II
LNYYTDRNPSQEAHKSALFTQYALAATHEALTDANWHPTTPSSLNATGVCLGSGIGNLSELYDTSLSYAAGSYRKIHPLFVPRLLLNLGAGMVSMRYGFRGPNHCATTACTTGAHSLGDAMRFVQHGAAEVMVAGSAEACVHPLAVGGFARSRSLSTSFNETPGKASRPFDRSRDGFVISEGAGVVVLEELQHALDRKANIYAELVGYGVSADAHHLTAPRPDGDGALRAMKMGLRDAQVSPASVGYINAHATSTPLGDRAENAAIKTLLGDSGVKAQEINVSSTKGAIGHLLGGAGSVEAIFTILALKHQTFPPTINLDEQEEEFDLNYMPKEAQERNVDVALSNSFGFGGTNASLCFRVFKG